MNKLILVDNSIFRVVFGNTRRLFYDNGNDGLSDMVNTPLGVRIIIWLKVKVTLSDFY